jgi:CNT family concentrative nucleoside transporter/purine nucleoside transport protein
MLLLINILGIFVFLGFAVLFSKNRKKIHLRAIGVCLALNLFLGWFLLKFSVGRDLIKGAAGLFTQFVDISFEGISFVIPAVSALGRYDFFISALLPILLIVPVFDILTYIGVMPLIIKLLGKALSFLTGRPKFESFFSIEMMVLGNTEAIIVSRTQIEKISPSRNLTVALMSMSCVTVSILGAYMGMMPPEYIITAVPLNVINAIIITSILNPVEVSPEEDKVLKLGESADGTIVEKEPFFAFLGDSILGAGRLILIIAASVLSFVALAGVINWLLGFIYSGLSLQTILGIIMYPFAFLFGLEHIEAFKFAQFMGLKLVTNEFVVMGQIGLTGSKELLTYSPHFRAVLTIFLTSFANFSTVGMILGCFKGVVDKEKNNFISKHVGLMLVSGILVSLMSGAIAGLFVW